MRHGNCKLKLEEIILFRHHPEAESLGSELSRNIEIHFAHRQIQVTSTNMIPLHKYKWASSPSVRSGGWLLEKLLQVLLFLVILLATCDACNMVTLVWTWQTQQTETESNGHKTTMLVQY